MASTTESRKSFNLAPEAFAAYLMFTAEGFGYKTLGKQDLLNLCELESWHSLVGYISDLVSLSSTTDPQYDQLLTIKFEEGAYSTCYPPAVFATPDNTGLVLRIGNNFAPITQEGSNFIAGSLTGSLLVEKIEGGYNRFFMRFKAPGYVYQIPLMMPKSSDFNFDDFEQLMDAGKSIGELLAPVKMGSVTFCNLSNLPIGDFEIVGIKLKPRAEYGRYNIELKGGVVVSPNTKLAKELEAAESTGLTIEQLSAHYRGSYLSVLGKETRQIAGVDRTVVTAKFSARAKNPVLPPVNELAALKPAKPVSDEEPKTVDVLAVPSSEDIPF